jgi:glycosyltransferase involved in cell wall biosynthesis
MTTREEAVATPEAPTPSDDVWPKVTAIVPTVDRVEPLRRAVLSVLGQRYPGEIECIVVFDGREPTRPDVVVPERRSLVLATNTRSPGLAGNRNTGAILATGEFVAFLDDDDAWHPDKLRRQIEAYRLDPGASMVSCGIVLTSGGRRHTRVPESDRLTLDDLTTSRRAEIHSSSILMRRDRFVNEIGLIDEEIPGSYGEDYDILLRAAKIAPIVVVTEPLVQVSWTLSYFNDRWATMIEAIHYHLNKHSELKTPRNLARMYGRLAFAHAADGEPRTAREWARRSIELNWKQPRGYLAYLVSWGLLKPSWVMRAAHAVGRGV